jgi:hypothetical protein
MLGGCEGLEPQLDTKMATPTSATRTSAALAIPERIDAASMPGEVSDTRRLALRNVLHAFISSRLLIWAAGIATALIFGWATNRGIHLDPAGLTRPFPSAVPNVLISPAARYDSAWFLSIAEGGYAGNLQTVFFPLYPATIALVGLTGLPQVVAGILLSCGFAIAALYLLHRLVELDFGLLEARNTVWIVAWLPVALFLSAVYSEALFLLLTVGSFYAGRLGRWWLAALLGALAAATRSSGILMVAPLLVLYLYGPRADRSPDGAGGGIGPRYKPRLDILWIALVPIGLIGYLAYLHWATGDPFAPFASQDHWRRSFEPLAGIPLGFYAAYRSITDVTFGIHPELPMRVIRHFGELAFLIGAGSLLWFGRRRLPAAYTTLAALSLAMTVSVPARGEPLKSLPRFTLVIFPLWVALALWATEKRRVRMVLAVCAPLLVAWTFMFTGWHWAP